MHDTRFRCGRECISYHQDPQPNTPSPEMIEVIASTIPQHFRVICPHSLTITSGLCPNTNCTMKKLCEVFYKRTCYPKNCKYVHEKKSCEVEVTGRGECNYLRLPRINADRRAHMRGAVHKRDVGQEEWRIRCVLAGLREAHVQGIYIGQKSECRDG